MGGGGRGWEKTPHQQHKQLLAVPFSVPLSRAREANTDRTKVCTCSSVLPGGLVGFYIGIRVHICIVAVIGTQQPK